VPDANALWDFREALIKADALDVLFQELDRAIGQAGFTFRAPDRSSLSGHHYVMPCRAVFASLIAAPHQRNSGGEKAAIEVSKTAQEIWPNQPAKAAQKDTNARCLAAVCCAIACRSQTVKYSKAKSRAPFRDICFANALPGKGRQQAGRSRDPDLRVKEPHIHLSPERHHPLGIMPCRTLPGSGRQIITDAAQRDGALLHEGLVQTVNTGRRVWADKTYRPAKNEAWLEANSMVSEVHHKKPRGRPMSKRHPRRMAASQSCVRMWSMSSGTKRIAWGSPSGPSAWPVPRRRSRWPTWSTTWADCGGFSAEVRPPDTNAGRKPTHKPKTAAIADASGR